MIVNDWVGYFVECISVSVVMNLVWFGFLEVQYV